MIEGWTSKGMLGFFVCAGLVLSALVTSAQAQAV